MSATADGVVHVLLVLASVAVFARLFVGLRDVRGAALGRVLDACIDEERVLDRQRVRVDAYRHAVLERLAKERAVGIARLTAVGAAQGAQRRGAWGAVRRALGRTRRGLTDASDGDDPIAACRRSCSHTQDTFDRALELPWPEPIREVLVEQHAMACGASQALSALQY